MSKWYMQFFLLCVREWFKLWHRKWQAILTYVVAKKILIFNCHLFKMTYVTILEVHNILGLGPMLVNKTFFKNNMQYMLHFL